VSVETIKERGKRINKDEQMKKDDRKEKGKINFQRRYEGKRPKAEGK
jgi:hypothetical protein